MVRAPVCELLAIYASMGKLAIYMFTAKPLAAVIVINDSKVRIPVDFGPPLPEPNNMGDFFNRLPV